jgi:hypothetical protein
MFYFEVMNYYAVSAQKCSLFIIASIASGSGGSCSSSSDVTCMTRISSSAGYSTGISNGNNDNSCCRSSGCKVIVVTVI